MNKTIDLRSDTVTKPTKEMLLAMMNAEVGDDVFGDDPTVNRLEELGAKIMGKEKALFVPTGTMGNQICINVNTSRGDEIIVQENHHIFKYEVGGIAALSGVQCKTLIGREGCYDLDELQKAIRENDIHEPESKIICLENTHNLEGGMVVPLSHMKKVKQFAEQNHLKVHLDGARIFHAAAYLHVPAAEIAQYADTVMFCLSKGLASPVGSLIAGSEEFIGKARKVRKRFGGGMRQVGILAACGILSLTEMTKRLWEDHENAALLAKGIAQIEGLFINPSKVHTNIVIFDIINQKLTADELLEKLKQKGILAITTDTYKIRLIPHYEISKEDCLYVIEALCEEMKKI